MRARGQCAWGPAAPRSPHTRCRPAVRSARRTRVPTHGLSGLPRACPVRGRARRGPEPDPSGSPAAHVALKCGERTGCQPLTRLSSQSGSRCNLQLQRVRRPCRLSCPFGTGCSSDEPHSARVTPQSSRSRDHRYTTTIQPTRASPWRPAGLRPRAGRGVAVAVRHGESGWIDPAWHRGDPAGQPSGQRPEGNLKMIDPVRIFRPARISL